MERERSADIFYFQERFDGPDRTPVNGPGIFPETSIRRADQERRSPASNGYPLSGIFKVSWGFFFRYNNVGVVVCTIMYTHQGCFLARTTRAPIPTRGRKTDPQHIPLAASLAASSSISWMTLYSSSTSAVSEESVLWISM